MPRGVTPTAQQVKKHLKVFEKSATIERRQECDLGLKGSNSNCSTGKKHFKVFERSATLERRQECDLGAKGS